MATTRTGARHARAFRAALALAAIAAGGCAGVAVRAREHFASYTFAIRFAGGCPDPDGLSVDHPNCGGGEKHCIRAERNAVVHFVAPGGEAFEIQASPFRAGNLASRDGKVDATIDAPPNPGKAYPFSILGAPKCPPLDPWIIVE